MKISYVGKKPHKTDRTFNTGIMWSGQGDVKEVDDTVAQKMVQRYPEIWAISEYVEDQVDIVGPITPIVGPVDGDSEPVTNEDQDTDILNQHWQKVLQAARNVDNDEVILDWLAKEKASESPRKAVLNGLAELIA